MACPVCGNFVIFGGVKDGKQRYCSKKCYDADLVPREAQLVPQALAERFSMELSRGPCPKCQGEGPVDIHESHSVYSVILYTKWQTKKHLVCKRCASRQQALDLIGSFIAGWWGIPFGLIVTPCILIMNVVSMTRNPGLSGPSEALKERARLILAANKLARAAS
jgi:endogenous inhibitor of DNA gyrase (YacG/DUF329 family)